MYAVEPPLSPEPMERKAVAESLERHLSTRTWGSELAIGTELLHAREFAGAIEHLAVAESLNPRSADVAALQSNAYHASRMYEAAALACLRAMTLGGATAQHYAQLGRIRFMQGRFRDASGSFESAVRMDPTDTGSLYLLGRSFYEAGDFRAAVSPLLTYLRTDPGFKDGRRMAALALAHSGDYSSAVALLRQGPRGAQAAPSALDVLADSLARARGGR